MGSTRTGDDEEFPIAIIGAGFAGIGTAIRLLQEGIGSFTIFEQAERVGGTWRDNTYPGCACDVPSHLYSLSFDQNPRWTHEFSGQAEILAYLEDVVARHGLRPFIRFGARVEGGRFDESTGTWTLKISNGEEFRARAVIAGVGPFGNPAIPDIPGRERFEGVQFHSSRWDHSYDLRGKRVASIGTGASAIQYVPEIAKEVDRLTVFQRTAPWVFPKPNRPYSEWAKRAFEVVPGLQRLYRSGIYWSWESRAVGFVRYPELLRPAEWLGRWHIRRSVKDPALRAKVTPDFSVGCKRVLGSDDWYPTLQRDNVELVTDRIVEIDEGGILTADGRRHEVDAIVWGTGFRVTDFLLPMRMHGLGGRELSDAWRNGAEAYYGIVVSGFPNLFMLLGPNTGLGHNSVVFMIEAQIHYVLAMIRRLRDEGLAYLDVKPLEQRRFNETIQERMKRTVWLTGCQSWYLDASGRNFTLWPGFTFEYWLRTRRPDPKAYLAMPRVAPARRSSAPSPSPGA